MTVSPTTRRMPAHEKVADGVDRPVLSVVPAVSDGRFRRVAFGVGIMVMFGLLLGVVAFHVHLVQRQRVIDELTVRAEQEQARYDRLRVTVDQLGAPGRIVAEASALGYVQPGDVTWLDPVEPDAESPATTVEPDPDDYPMVKPYLGATR